MNENECRGNELAKNLIVNQGFVAPQEIVKTEVSGCRKKPVPGRADLKIGHYTKHGKGAPDMVGAAI